MTKLALMGEDQSSQTDFCTTELLHPHYLALRNSLAMVLKQNTAGEGTAALVQGGPEEGKTP
ncbi:MAG: hypothetical protein OEY28_07515 [Nitrospira sp.]|nr:hypothetical protein [Nitrospira sp.]